MTCSKWLAVISFVLFCVTVDQGVGLHQLAAQNDILNQTTASYYDYIQDLTKDLENDEWLIKDLHKKIDALNSDKQSMWERLKYGRSFLDHVNKCETLYCRNSCTGHLSLPINDLKP